MEHKTPNGKEYQIGTKFKVNDLDVYRIDRIEINEIFITGLSNNIKEMAWNRKRAEVLFDENTNWKLIEMNTHKTPNGIVYQIGTRFKHYQNTSDDIFEITNISMVGRQYKYKNLSKPHTLFKETLDQLHQYFDEGTWIIILDYKSIDPTTIKFDFTNKEVVMNNAQESDWVQRAAFANGHSWYDSKNNQPEYTDAKLITFWDDTTITYTNNLDWDGENSKFTLITIQDILNAQTMEQAKIEAGDLVEYIVGTTLVGQQRIVEFVSDRQVWFNKATTSWDRPESLKIVTKAANLEIIGFELLKDLPLIVFGTKSSPYLGKGRGGVVFEHNARAYFATEEELEDRNWFKPLYKPKLVSFEISNNQYGQRVATITLDDVRIDYNDSSNPTSATVKHNELFQIYNALTMALASDSYSITFNSVQVGCQEFSRKDIERLYKTVQEIK